jgi:hypothetical protein
MNVITPKLLETRLIWNEGGHNAFTDLIRFRERWYCVFREGGGHVSREGTIRILASTDGGQWESVGLLTSPHPDLADLRDPKVCLTPDGRLILTATAVCHDEVALTHQSYVWFSADGTLWSEPAPIGEPNYWVWRVTWHDGKAYAAAYHATVYYREPELRLYVSDDGIHFEVLVETLLHENRPNESTLLFEGDEAFSLTRHEGGPATAMLGRAKAPYREWNWLGLGAPLGGPNFIRLPAGLFPDNHFLVGGRFHENGAHMALGLLDADSGTLTELLALPSGGDTSYPGLVWHEGVLWVSYYSSHEGKTTIYVAQVQL